MTKDIDLCRKILFQLERQNTNSAIINLHMQNYDSAVIAYHCYLLYEAGLVSSFDCNYADNCLSDFSVGLMTFKGHDFLDKIREDSVWKKVIKTIKDNNLPITTAIIKITADTFVQQAVAKTLK